MWWLIDKQKMNSILSIFCFDKCNNHPALLTTVSREFWQQAPKSTENMREGAVLKSEPCYFSQSQSKLKVLAGSDTQLLWPLFLEDRAFLGFLAAHSPPCLLAHLGRPKEQFQDHFSHQTKMNEQEGLRKQSRFLTLAPGFPLIPASPWGKSTCFMYFLVLSGFGLCITLCAGGCSWVMDAIIRNT